MIDTSVVPGFRGTHPGDGTVLPDEQISHLAVQPRLQKYFASRLTQITSISPAVLFHRGADRASSRTRDGMRWTRERKACNGNRRAR